MKESPQTGIEAHPTGVPALRARRSPREIGALVIVAGFAALAAAAGGFLALRQGASIRRGVTPYVQAVATFRADELGRWLAERHGDAVVASRDPVIAAAADVPAAVRVSTPTYVAAGRRLDIIARSYGYQAVAVLDRSGAQVLGTGGAIGVDDPGLRAEFSAAMASGEVQISKLVWFDDPGPGQVSLDVVAPLQVEGAAGAPRAVGALVLRVELRAIVAAVLGPAPAASSGGELALLVRGGARNIVLFPKRLAAGRPWIVQSGGGSVTALGSPASAAIDLWGASGESGHQVVAVAAPVTGAPWVVLGKVDMAEFTGPSIRVVWLTCGLIATLLLGGALLIYSLWKRRSEGALRASEEKFRNIFENMQDGYVLTNPDGQISMVNPAVVRMLGYRDAGDLCGMNMERDVFVVPAERVALQAKLHAEGGVLHGQKVTLKRKDGSPVIVEVHLRLLRDQQGVTLAIEGVVRDMTSHYEIREELIRAREAALAAAQIKAQFLANMSHEIRTPLNAIVGLGHLLARAELTPQLAGYVANIQASVRMLLDVVNNVLDFSKIEAGRLTLESIPFEMEAVLGGVEKVLSQPARDKGLQLVCVLDDRVPRTLCGDPVRLGQVLTNLADNGVKFTAAGTVTVRIEPVDPERDLRPGRALVRFVVSDTGMGIAPERAATMFEPFVQADGSTTRRFGGTGLGLAICRQLVAALGGQLTVDSSPGQGSRFSFILDFEAPSVAVVARPAPAAPLSLRGARILVVEDNAINQQVARELLEGVGAIVRIVDSGQGAVEAALGPGPAFDAVLMDLQMPGMDGFEAARAIRRDPSRGKVPIIAMTAHAFEQEKGKCLAAGMNDHIAKPVEPARLWETLLRWVQPRTVPVPAQGPVAARPQAGAGEAPIAAGGPLLGIDAAAGLRRVGNNLALYHRLLGRFAQEWRDVVARLRPLLANRQMTDARRLAHTLKGTAATLGIDGISVQAGAIETLLSEADPRSIAAELARLETSVVEICAAIALVDVGPVAAAPAAPGPSAQPALATIVELESLLGRRNLRAREAVDRLRNTPLPAVCQGPLEQVVGNVARLDYAEAAVALAELKALLSRAPTEMLQ